MIKIAIGCLLVGALGGAVMAAIIFRGQRPPWALAIAHGALGALGLVLLLVAVAGGAAGLIQAGLAVLVLAALGGFYLVSFHARNLDHPRPVIIVHALVAVVGVGLLIAGVLGGA